MAGRYPRTDPGRRKDSQFQCTLAGARDGALYQVEKLGGALPVISTDIPVKKDGLLYASGRPVSNDPGVAVYFQLKKEQMVLACDQYKTIRENLRAIEKSLEAMRGLDRWGCSDILSRAFTGFKALPEHAGPGSSAWWDVLEVLPHASAQALQANYRRLLKDHHPDRNGGDSTKFHIIQKAWAQARAERKDL